MKESPVITIENGSQCNERAAFKASEAADILAGNNAGRRARRRDFPLKQAIFGLSDCSHPILG
jgi:hypothetical protein